AGATDALLHHGGARMALAAALRAAGRHADAAAEEARGIDLWEAKGATVLAERARTTVARGEPVARAPEGSARPRGRVHRRVGANAVTAFMTRLDAAIAARDADALATLFADEWVVLDHTTKSTLDAGEVLRSLRFLLRVEQPTCRHEALATLGD